MDQSTIKRKLAGAGVEQNLIDIRGKSRVAVRDLTIDGNSTSFISQFHHLIGVTNSTYVTVEKVRLYRMTSDGVYVGYQDGHSEHIRICNNEFENTSFCMRNAISVVRADDVAITGNVFRHVSQNTMPGAIDVEPLSGEPTHDCSDILIEGNRFYDTATNDIQVSAGEMDIRNVVIRNNYHKNSGADGASNAKGAVYCHIRSPYTGELSDVFIDGNYFDGVRDSAVFVTNGKRVAVHNNYITNQYMEGIYLGSSYSTGVFDASRKRQHDLEVRFRKPLQSRDRPRCGHASACGLERHRGSTGLRRDAVRRRGHRLHPDGLMVFEQPDRQHVVGGNPHGRGRKKD